MKTQYKLILIFLLTMVANCFALTPVIDLASIKKMAIQIKQMQRTYQLLQDQYNAQKAEINTLIAFKKLFESHSEIGKILTSKKQLEAFAWSPARWNDAMKGLSGNNSEEYKALIKRLIKSDPALIVKNIQKMGAKDVSIDYDKRRRFLLNAKAQSEAAYDAVNQKIDRIISLNNEIGKSKDIKASMDLNTRVLVELALLTSEEIKLQSLLNHQIAEQHFNDIRSLSSALAYAHYSEKEE